MSSFNAAVGPGCRPQLFVFLAWFALARAAMGEGLSLESALAIAVNEAPVLIARESGIEGARAAVIPAGALPDPKLLLGVDNLPVAGPARFELGEDFMTMERVGLMQEFPNAAKRRARRATAEAAVAVAEARARHERLRVLQQTAQAWLAARYAEQRLAAFADLEHDSALFADSVAARVASGRGSAADALLAKMEGVRLVDRRDELMQTIAVARAELRRYVGGAADQRLTDEIPNFSFDHTHLRDRLQQHPELAAMTAKAHEAAAEVLEAAADKRPDWGVEFAYQHRGADFGDMIMLEFSVDLPIFADTRQEPRILARQAVVNGLEAERESMLRDHQAVLEAQLAEHARLGRTLARYDEALLPLARARVELGIAAYAAATGTIDTAIKARSALTETRLERLTLEERQRSLAAAIHFAFEEALP